MPRGATVTEMHLCVVVYNTRGLRVGHSAADKSRGHVFKIQIDGMKNYLQELSVWLHPYLQ